MFPFNLFKRKEKRADEALNQLKSSLVEALGSNLTSVILFGSKASGEFRDGRSDINLLLVLNDIHWDALERMAPALRTWSQRGHRLPVMIETEELGTYARALPIEFLDMRDHHVVLHGEDPIAGLAIDAVHLRSQCEHEMAVKQLKLRQALALASGDPKKIREVLVGSLPSVLTIFRSIYRLKKDQSGLRKLEAADRLSELLDFDPSPLHRIHDLKLRRAEDEVHHVAQRYLDIIEKVESYMRGN